MLVDRPLQMRMTVWFAATGALAVLLQFVLTLNVLGGDAADPAGPSPLAVGLHSFRILFLSLLVGVPAMTLVGIAVSFRICGPLRAVQRFLEATRDGAAPPDLVLRKGDDLRELVDLLNETTRPLRGERGEREAA